jgi:hypothetical protein
MSISLARLARWDAPVPGIGHVGQGETETEEGGRPFR